MPTKYAYVEIISATPYSRGHQVTYYHIMPGYISFGTGNTFTEQERFIHVLTQEWREKNTKVVTDRLPLGVRSIDEITYQEDLPSPIHAEVKRLPWRRFSDETWRKR